ncbi:hypothetical protein ACFQU9_45360 [Actinomadura namibiensis]|uniref:Uncharacterized protein n=1 Tax=Actinomadura namibiensis TaxID=182080 RepID=A0A7W3LUI5_ACTNM|nr:hypothetical protein [Actinomadura namibiensis]MBA8954480.1 hypothetical protein [Actinomadura namibiensis]
MIPHGGQDLLIFGNRFQRHARAPLHGGGALLGRRPGYRISGSGDAAGDVTLPDQRDGPERRDLRTSAVRVPSA